MEFVLLCHSRERVKKSNTGRLALQQPSLAARQIVWSRIEPDTQLLADINAGHCWLLYPVADTVGVRLNCVNEADQARACDRLTPLVGQKAKVILIDATWQQAQKMFNQSPYLHHLPRLELARESPSGFRLRRNQKPGGLCTVECIIELLYLNGQVNLAQHLHKSFEEFMAQPKN
jgi:DTW domain-containing protein